MDRLKDKVAIITGAAQGIGEGIARAMAHEGAMVCLWDIKGIVKEKAMEISSIGQKAISFIVDVTDTNQINKAVHEILERFGRVDVLVNNAGVGFVVPFLETSDEVRDKTLDVNFNGVWNCIKAVLPVMINQRGGKIINISSTTGTRVAAAELTAYSASKGAVLGFTKALALELAEYNINVNAILPGYVDTSLMRNSIDPETLEEIIESVPMKRLGRAEELGNLAVFLASEESKYITGQEIVIDGGNIIQEIKIIE